MNYWLLIICTVLPALYAFFKLKYNYWEARGVKQQSGHNIWSNTRKLKSLHHTQLLQEVYDEFKGKARLAGTYIFTEPIAVLLDLDLVKTVLIKDFDKFVDRFTDHNSKDILSQHLFRADGDIWKVLRSKVSPTFTSGKIKHMFPSIVNVAQKLVVAFEKELLRMPDQCVELHDLNARFTTDVIGTCVFGVECNSLIDPNAEFREIGRQAFGRSNFYIRWHLMKRSYMKYLRLIGARIFPTHIESFFVRIVNDTVLEREKRNICRNDFIDVLIELKNQTNDQGKPLLSMDLVAAQLFAFFAAGFETSSSNMSYGLFELAKNPDKQEKVREEIMAILKKHNNELTYEAMMEMKYLDQVVSETLRLYPALSFLHRVCMQDYQLPETNITLEKGTTVYIPAKAFHYDPDIYKNPHQFQPERFDPAEVQSRHPQAFLGFGDGPRNCLGLRFGRMQVKIGLISLLLKYRFSFSSKTPDKVDFSNYSVVMIPANGVWLRVDKL